MLPLEPALRRRDRRIGRSRTEHGEDLALGRALGAHRASLASSPSASQGRAAAGSRSGDAHGDLVRLADGDPLGVPASGGGVGFRGHVLATASSVAAGGGLEEAAPLAVEAASGGRPHRLVPRGGGLELDSGGGGGEKTGPNPTDRARKGSKHHVCTDGQGIPLAFELTAANVNDGKRLLALVDAIPPIPGLVGRPRRRPLQVQGDRAYGSAANRRAMKARGIEPVLARPRTEHGSGLGLTRWVVERTHSWFHQFRRLRVRFERQAKIHEAFLRIGACLICLRFLDGGF